MVIIVSEKAMMHHRTPTANLRQSDRTRSIASVAPALLDTSTPFREFSITLRLERISPFVVSVLAKLAHSVGPVHERSVAEVLVIADDHRRTFRPNRYNRLMTAPTRRILATSGGMVPGPVQMTWRLSEQLLHALTLTGKTRPRVCLLETAIGDAATFYALGLEAFAVAGCDVTPFRVFPQPSGNPEEILGSADLIWVGGGSVANLLTLWRLHHIDEAMAAAWERGTILGGVSAGSICWHVGGTTDSFGPELKPVTNGLALLPYGNGVHYDSEAQRRPLLHSLVADGTMPEVNYATDDRTGILYEGTTPVAVLTDRPVDPVSGPAAYRVERRGGEVVETRLAPGPIVK